MQEEKKVPNMVSEKDRIVTNKEAEPEILSYKDVKINYTEKPKNIKRRIEIIVALIVLILFFLAFYMYETDNKNVLRIGVNTAVNKIENTFYSVRSSKFLQFNLKKTFKTSMIMSFNTSFNNKKITDDEISFLQKIKDTTISLTGDFDYPNQTFTYSLKSTNDGANIIEIYGNGNEKGITYRIKNILGTYILEKIDNFQKFYQDSASDKQEIDKIKENMIKTLFRNIKKGDLTRTEVTLEENNLKVKDITFKLTDEYIKQLLSKTIDDLMQDSTFIKNVMNYTNLTETRLKEHMTDLKEEINNNTLLKEDVTLHIYVKGIFHTFIGIKLESNSTSLLYISYKKEGYLKLINEEEEIINIQKQIVDSSMTEYKITYKDTKIALSKLIKNTSTVYDYEIEEGKYIYTGSITITDEEATSKEGNVRFSISKLDEDANELWNINSTINYSVKTTSSINLYDDSEALEVNDETKEEIKSRVLKSENLKDLMDSFQKFLQNA